MTNTAKPSARHAECGPDCAVTGDACPDPIGHDDGPMPPNTPARKFTDEDKARNAAESYGWQLIWNAEDDRFDVIDNAWPALVMAHIEADPWESPGDRWAYLATEHNIDGYANTVADAVDALACAMVEA